VSIHVALNHVTHYRYDRRVGLSPQVVRLRPAPHCRTPILSLFAARRPGEHFINWQQDPFANHLARLVFPEKTTEFKVTVDLVAEMAVYNPFDFFLEPEAESSRSAYAPELAHDLQPYLAKWPLTDQTPRQGLRRQHPARQAAHHRLPRRPQPAPAARDRLPDPHGARRADARSHADQRPRAPAATPAGCWCRCCATWDWRRASSPAT
jgi:transglutaminase-like putative cysteine protease